MKFADFLLTESINDKGIFKAIFVIGIPGSGKSYTSQQMKGVVSPKVVNTDNAFEYFADKFGKEANTETWNTLFGSDSKRITQSSLYHYINGMLPLIIDGTSSDASNILSRTGILESLGYDVGVVYVNTDLETAKKRVIERAKKINRTVDHDFIEKVHSKSEANKKYFKSKFSFFKEIDNNDFELSDKAMVSAYKAAQSFYLSEVENPIGSRTIESLKDAQEKYLVPSEQSKETIESKLQNWYKKK